MARVCALAAQAALLLLAAASSATAAAPPHASVWTPAFPTMLDDSVGSITIPLAGTVSAPSLFALYGHMTIGSPPQSFRVVFETGEDAVWVPNFRSTQPSPTRVAYDHSKSHTYEPDGAGAIAEGLVYSYFGFRSRDSLSFGNVLLTNATFVEATQVPTPSNFDDFAIDGMFGLSPRLANNWVLARLVHIGALDQPVFAFYLPRTRGTRSDATDSSSSAGELVIGAVDSHRFSGTVRYVDTVCGVLQAVAWAVPLGSGTAGDVRGHRNSSSERVPLVTKAARAEIITTLPLIIGPKEDVARLAKLVGADGSMIDCTAPGPDIEVNIGGVAYVLTKNDYTLRDSSVSETCRWAFAGTDLPDTWWFGQPFLQAVYTVFEFGDGRALPRLGFAQAV